jgi:hypothetical protein
MVAISQIVLVNLTATVKESVTIRYSLQSVKTAAKDGWARPVKTFVMLYMVNKCL